MGHGNHLRFIPAHLALHFLYQTALSAFVALLEETIKHGVGVCYIDPSMYYTVAQGGSNTLGIMHFGCLAD